MTSKVNEVLERAVGVLRENVTPHGLKASKAYYNQVWARDSFITFLGSNLLGDEELLKAAKTTVNTLAKSASELGQIPNLYDLSTDRPDFGFSGATDASAWYVIGLASLFEATHDWNLLKEPFDAALGAIRWLRFQDANNTWLVDSPQGADWMDAAVQRTGKTLYNNILFVMATRCAAKLAEASGRPTENAFLLDHEKLAERFRDVFLPGPDSPERIAAYSPRLASLYSESKPLGLSKAYFLHYVSFARVDSKFDTLSNVLCILSRAAGPETSRSVLEAAQTKRISKPFPVRVLDQPYHAGEMGYDSEFDSALPAEHRSQPLRYHNGAVWPFVGGLYVCALFLTDVDYARKELLALANANMAFKEGESTGFNEWMEGKNGKPLGQIGQSWNAGTYIAAYRASKGENPFKFLE